MIPLPPQTVSTALRWRYATRKFDASRQIPETTWTALEDALVLSPSSIGLQPWRFIVVTEAPLRARLFPVVHRQPQVMDCSHFVVFAVHRNLGEAHVNRHVGRMAEVRGVAPETLEKFGQMALRNLDTARAAGRLDTWQTHQVYIALGSFLVAAAMLGVDTCPMEGMDPNGVDQVLGLAGTDYATVVACAAGYRAQDDKYAALKKVRFAHSDVIVRR